MTVIIEIEDEESKSDLMAIGAHDLRNHFFSKKLGIKAKSVRISDIEESEKIKKVNGETYKSFEDISGEMENAL